MSKRRPNGVANETCRSCGAKLTTDNTYPLQRKHRDYICKKCIREANTAWVRRNRKWHNEQTRASYWKNYPEHVVTKRNGARLWQLNLKMEVFKHYSPELKCQNPNCEVAGGARDIRSLSIDHINGGGNKQRKKLGGGGWKLWRWLKAHDYPKGYRVLCMNCQFVTLAIRRNTISPIMRKLL